MSPRDESLLHKTQSPFHGVPAYNVLTNPAAAMVHTAAVPQSNAVCSSQDTAEETPETRGFHSMRSADYNPCVVSSDSGTAAAREAEMKGLETEARSGTNSHTRAGTMLLKRHRSGLGQPPAGSDYLAALQRPTSEAIDALSVDNPDLRGDVLSAHQSKEADLAVRSEDVIKQQRKQV